MKGKPSTAQNNGSRTSVKSSRLPPEERFWQRYSPHHEFPLSVSSSVFVHIVGLVLLVFGGGLLWLILGNRGDHSLPVDAIAVEGGGGGDPHGLGNERGDGIVPTGPEAGESGPARASRP